MRSPYLPVGRVTNCSRESATRRRDDGRARRPAPSRSCGRSCPTCGRARSSACTPPTRSRGTPPPPARTNACRTGVVRPRHPFPRLPSCRTPRSPKRHPTIREPRRPEDVSTEPLKPDGRAPRINPGLITRHATMARCRPRLTLRPASGRRSGASPTAVGTTETRSRPSSTRASCATSGSPSTGGRG